MSAGIMAADRRRRLAGISLLVFAMTALGAGVWREMRAAGGAAQEAAVGSTSRPRSADVVTVYYLHGDKRCTKCIAIEAGTKRAVAAAFPRELESGRVVLETINYDSPAGRRYADTFELAFGSVVVQKGDLSGAYENLVEVWDLIGGEPAAFDAYVATGVRAILEAGR